MTEDPKKKASEERRLIGGKKPGAAAFQRAAVVLCVESFELRLAPAAPLALSIDRATPPAPYANVASVSYTVLFDRAVTGVDAADFRVITHGNLNVQRPVVVAGSGASYSVTINGIHGSGDLRLDLIDNDSIAAGGEPLAGVGANNGSFQGETYFIQQAFPTVVSIERASAGPTTSASTVHFTVTFSKGVTGVDPTDFEIVKTGAVAATQLQVTPVSASVYTATVSGITGEGDLGLNLVDDGSIHDLAGNPLGTADTIDFAGQATFATGSMPTSATMGDVNADGKTDLVVANYGSDSVGVLLGNGDGTFQEQQTYATGASPDAVTIGDINGDGKADLAVAQYGSSRPSVFLGNGNGTFQARMTLAALAIGTSVALGDVDGDGKPDLAVANSDAVSVFLGNGDGTFAPQDTFDTGAAPYGLQMIDLNGDGALDLAVANYGDDTVSVLLGVGDGTFAPQQTFATGHFPNDLAVGDVNGDGKPDLAVANYDDNTIGVLLGNGDGTFQEQQVFDAGAHPYSLTVGDVNGDGKPDLAVANFADGTLGVLLGNGDGTFQAQQAFDASLTPYSVALGDVNGDGRADLAVSNSGSDTVSVFLATGNGGSVGPQYTLTQNGAASTTTTITAMPNATTGGMLVTFTATVGPSPGNLGTVTFKDNGTALAGANNIAVVGGVATFQTAALTVGTHPIRAEYSGGPNFLGSTSNTLSLVVSAATPQLVGVTVNGNIAALAGPQRSRVAGLAVIFNQPVQLDIGAMTLVRHTNSVAFDGAPQPAGFGTLPNSLNRATTDNQTWSITFVGNTDNGLDGLNSLRDGVYDLKIDGSMVHPLGVPGVSMASSPTFTFHRLFGDTNAPETPSGGTPNVDFLALVNTGDNFDFRSAFNRPVGGGYQAFLDFDGSGIINTGDNLEFRDRFNRALTWRM